ncbi:MAG: M14-type cytosolic carboxypeptidase [Armatimonadota bacterium]|nr:M14-type cytosolic carboxypeptidase [Armatimonadota bacterium]MDW8025407.1 M14-type cytosolic carboxypeptidase [Armatimonadota bacterium]
MRFAVRMLPAFVFCIASVIRIYPQVNPHRVLDLPEGCAMVSVPKVSCDFDSGNVCAVDIKRSDYEWHVRFAADPHGGTEALWFYFRVDSNAGDAFKLILTNAESCLGGRGDWSNVHPVVRHLHGCEQRVDDWQRCNGGTMHRLPDGRFEVSWDVRSLTGSFEFALCYPYTHRELGETLNACGGYWRCDVIGVTQKGRSMLRLSNSYGSEKRDKPGIYILARQHSGETPGSWVLDGLLRYAPVELSPDELIIWAVPFANLDGVVDGDYGKDPHPIDLNRAWFSPLPMRHEVAVIQADIERFAKRCKLIAVIDLHAPAVLETYGAYFQLLKPVSAEADASKRFVDAIKKQLPKELVHEELFRIAQYPSRWNEQGTLSHWTWERFAIPAPVLEVPYSKSRETLLEIEHYRQLGSLLVRGLKEYANEVQ